MAARWPAWSPMAPRSSARASTTGSIAVTTAATTVVPAAAAKKAKRPKAKRPARPPPWSPAPSSAMQSCASKAAAPPSRRSSSGTTPREGAEGSPGAALLGVEPVGADAGVDLERRIELVGGGHLRPHQLERRVHLLRRALEEELVVDLQHQAGRHPLLPQAGPAAHHRHLDDVGGGALDHRVDSKALTEAPRVRVAGAQLGDRPAAPHQGGHVALLLRPFDHFLAEAAHRREALEVAGDEFLRLFARDVEAVGQAEAGQPVDDPEVDHFRFRALADVDLVR